MAKRVLRNVKITVGGTDLSDHCSSVTLDDSADEVEFTSFGSTYREYGQGMKAAGIDADYFNDEAAGSVAATHQPLYESGGTFAVKVWPESAGTVVYTMIARLYGNTLPSGAVGDADTVSVSYKNAGTAGITRGTA
jgi:hypothetical protein